MAVLWPRGRFGQRAMMGAAADPQAAMIAASWLGVKMLAPLLGAGLAAGLALAILQAITQINDSAISFTPKLLATLAAGLITAPFIARALGDFMHAMISAVIAAGGA